MITPKNLVHHELIGLRVRVVEPAPFAGLSGMVVDETRNTLTLEVRGQDKKIPKDQVVFSFTLPSGERVRVAGKLLVARPEDRIKKRIRKW